MTIIFQKIDQRATYMGAMMRHLDVPLEAAAGGMGLQLASAACKCLLCRPAGRCGRSLEAPEADPTAWQEFCPNAELFARLRY